jgi:hypothetical protein
VSAGLQQGALGSVAARRLPPIAELVMASMAMVIAGGIYLAAHLPNARHWARR